mgnify:CR=1 FL=1
MVDVEDFHAHVYFGSDDVAKARRICEACRDTFGVEMGRVHENPVGPHPDGSCQLRFGPDKFADVTTWLALNRDGLVVFIHPNTGHALEDHRDHALWMGAVRPLKLSVFDASAAAPDKS